LHAENDKPQMSKTGSDLKQNNSWILKMTLDATLESWQGHSMQLFETALSRYYWPFGMSRVFVQKDCDAIDGATALEVVLNLLGRCAVIDIANEDTAGIDVLSTLATGGWTGVIWICRLLVLTLHLG
jgi:hypothetical protein